MINLTKEKKILISYKGNINDTQQRRKLIFFWNSFQEYITVNTSQHRFVILLLCIIFIAFILDPGFILPDLLIDIVISNVTILCTIHFFGYRQGRVYKEYGYITRPTRAQGHYYFSVTTSRKLGQIRIVVFIEYVDI